MKLRKNEMKLRRNFLTPTWRFEIPHVAIRERWKSDKFPRKDMLLEIRGEKLDIRDPITLIAPMVPIANSQQLTANS